MTPASVMSGRRLQSVWTLSGPDGYYVSKSFSDIRHPTSECACTVPLRKEDDHKDFLRVSDLKLGKSTHDASHSTKRPAFSLDPPTFHWRSTTYDHLIGGLRRKLVANQVSYFLVTHSYSIWEFHNSLHAPTA
jgi:hypothetical protein